MDWRSKALDLWQRGHTWSQLVEALKEYFPGKTDIQIKDTLRSYIRRTKEYKNKNLTDNRCSIEYRPDGTIVQDKLIEICEGEEITPESIVRAHGLDPAQWTVISYRNNYWHSQVKGGKRLVMYQSRLTVKPAANLTAEHIEEVFKKLDRTVKPLPIKRVLPSNGYVAEVNIADLHLGKLCWHGDTGNNYDYKIARKIFYDVIGDIVAQLQTMPISKIVFVWSNDFFNSDTINKTTTAGTLQDTDIRWPKLYDVGVEMLTTGIETLKQIAPVETFYLPSNHDTMTAYYAAKHIEAFFRHDPDVSIDCGARTRKYRLYGISLVGYAHGHKPEKRGKYNAKELAAAMPVDVPDLWAKSKIREFHTGHLHSEQSVETLHGVTVRKLAGLTATDTYHDENCFIGASRKAQTFIYDLDKGIVQIINTPVF